MWVLSKTEEANLDDLIFRMWTHQSELRHTRFPAAAETQSTAAGLHKECRHGVSSQQYVCNIMSWNVLVRRAAGQQRGGVCVCMCEIKRDSTVHKGYERGLKCWKQLLRLKQMKSDEENWCMNPLTCAKRVILKRRRPIMWFVHLNVSVGKGSFEQFSWGVVWKRPLYGITSYFTVSARLDCDLLNTWRRKATSALLRICCYGMWKLFKFRLH